MLNDDAHPTMALTAHEYKSHEAILKPWKVPKDAEQHVTLLNLYGLIAFKAKAYLDLSREKTEATGARGV